MKRTAAVIWTFLLLAGTGVAAPVSLDVARQAALNWLQPYSLKKLQQSDIISEMVDRERNLPLCYMLDFGENGWVIVAADDVAFPVIGFSTAGNFSQRQSPPAFVNWMNQVKKGLRAAIQRQTGTAAKVADAWEALHSNRRGQPRSGTPVKGPLLTTTWNQNKFYNAHCPEELSVDPSFDSDGHVLAGCGAVAMAQVMKYHAHPATGFSSHSYHHPRYGELTANFGATAYDWNSMPPALHEPHDQTATIIYHCGVAVEMNYQPEGSGAYSEDIRQALISFFKYEQSTAIQSKADFTDEAWESLLKAELNDDRPMIYSGESGNQSGHLFICDGYTEENYFHFNWGWGGYLDGYFRLSNLAPDDQDDFTFEQQAIVGIKPASIPNLTYPYTEGFESGALANWFFSGPRAGVSSDDAHTGSRSILLNSPTAAEWSKNSVQIKINVPPGGARLTFHVLRKYDPAATQGKNEQRAYILPEYGSEILFTIFKGEFNDQNWQVVTVDLTPWQNSVISLFCEQFTTMNFHQWMYIDDIEITQAISLADLISILRVLSGIPSALTTMPDMNGNGVIDMVDAIMVMQALLVMNNS